MYKNRTIPIEVTADEFMQDLVKAIQDCEDINCLAVNYTIIDDHLILTIKETDDIDTPHDFTAIFYSVKYENEAIENILRNLAVSTIAYVSAHWKEMVYLAIKNKNDVADDEITVPYMDDMVYCYYFLIEDVNEFEENTMYSVVPLLVPLFKTLDISLSEIANVAKLNARKNIVVSANPIIPAYGVTNRFQHLGAVSMVFDDLYYKMVECFNTDELLLIPLSEDCVHIMPYSEEVARDLFNNYNEMLQSPDAPPPLSVNIYKMFTNGPFVERKKLTAIDFNL